VTASASPNRQTTPAAPLASHRVLGLLGMLGSPVFLLQWLTSDPLAANAPLPQGVSASLLRIAYLVAWACSAVGLRRLRATGTGRGAAAIFAVQVVGLLLAASQELQDLTGVRPLGDAFYTACDIAWPASHVFMLVVGAAVLRAGVWTGWRRWTPLACGLVVPAMFAASALGGPAAMGAVFGIGTAVAFFSLGLALFTFRGASHQKEPRQ
jgi:hypothetical protein